MNFLLIHQAFNSPRQAGGTRHFELARHCVEAGDEFAVIASRVSYLDGKATPACPARETLEGVEIRRLRMPGILHVSLFWRAVSFVWFMLKATWAAAMWRGHVDAIIGTTPPLPQALAALVAAKLRRRPFVLEVRDLWPDFAIDMGVLKSKALIYVARCAERLLYRRAAHIVVNSPAYVDYLLAKGVNESRITLVPNGVTPAMFDPQQRGAATGRRFELDGKFVVTYAGAIGPATAIDVIIDAAEQLSGHADIHFLIVGDGKSRRQMEDRARQLGLTNITFAGTLPKSQMPDVLGASDACVATLMDIPMFAMTYPNKVFDYMAAGRPTILAIDGVIREVIDACEGGLFVPPGDGAALASAVLQLKADPVLGEAMGQRARRHVEAHFDRAKQAELFREVIHCIAETGSFDRSTRQSSTPIETVEQQLAR